MKKGYGKYLAMAIGFGMLGDMPHGMAHEKPDPSTRERTETCPECGDEHHRSGHIFCSDKCHQIRKEKIKNGELK